MSRNPKRAAPPAPENRPGTGHVGNPGQFQKGQSGNPGGRPAGLVHVKQLAREQHAEAIATLVTIMRKGEPDSSRVSTRAALTFVPSVVCTSNNVGTPALTSVGLRL